MIKQLKNGGACTIGDKQGTQRRGEGGGIKKTYPPRQRLVFNVAHHLIPMSGQEEHFYIQTMPLYYSHKIKSKIQAKTYIEFMTLLYDPK